ncbi:LysR family transcriptional regulator [Bradyrhizobium sp. Arg237L]|uniref:LysR family transcriptional regulator n=1 Tax=Bradyrhizobium sp. Arg237L TaxID=3003352 RepID=UPI00249DE7B0|nr:LysR family transcriptional regulator [Bradyrhizobium sp. Arg237L]MDI4237935.1 LysR family transcriptional regulator [Bradyrhizobium sp. Arg237L]
MRLQLYQVRYFLALARTLNFTQAAKQCNVTQPALTKAVQKLEEDLGGTLIHRERHLTQLTELGKMILPTLEKIFAAAEAVRLQARGYQKKTIAPLKIGLVPSVSAALLTELLLELVKIIPDLRIDLREADANGLVAMLLDGEINAALVGGAVELPERIDRWPLFEERYVLVLSRKHPMARQTVIPLQDLHEAVFLERVGCDVAGRFKQACFADHPGPKVVHRSAEERHLQQMASAGFGAILAPEHAPRLPSLAAIPIEGDPVRREVQLLAVAGRQYSPALDAFIKVARVRDWTNALGKLRSASATGSKKDNVGKADAKGAGALIQITGPGPASSCPSSSRASNRRC